MDENHLFYIVDMVSFLNLAFTLRQEQNSVKVSSYNVHFNFCMT